MTSRPALAVLALGLTLASTGCGLKDVLGGVQQGVRGVAGVSATPHSPGAAVLPRLPPPATGAAASAPAPGLVLGGIATDLLDPEVDAGFGSSWSLGEGSGIWRGQR